MESKRRDQARPPLALLLTHPADSGLGQALPPLPPLDLQTLNAHVPPSQSGRCKAAGTEEPQPSLLLPTQQTPPHAACVPRSDAESHARQHATPNQGGHQQFTRSLSEKC